MSIEKISLIDSQGQIFVLPKTFELRSSPSARRSEVLETAFAHGGVDVSDSCFMAKYIEVSGKIWAKSDAEYNIAWDVLAEHLIKENIKIQNRGRQIHLKKIVSISHEYPSTVNYHYGEVSIIFLAIDPFWYSVNATEQEVLVTSSPKNFQFDIGGKMTTWPKIIFKNNANNYNFTLKNITDLNRSFTVQDIGAVVNTVIEVDCRKGTVIRNSTNLIAAFSGLFLKLLGGRTNQLSYSGANCKIKFQYFESWL